MSATLRSRYRCSSGICTYTSEQWQSRCPLCDEFLELSTASERGRAAAPPRTSTPATRPAPPQLVVVPSPEEPPATPPRPRPEVVPITEIEASEYQRFPTGLAPLDLVLGGGLVPGGTFLIHGDPGAGKSTLLTQMMALAHRPSGEPCERLLWASAEEAPGHIALRARRVGAAHARIGVLHCDDTDQILEHARRVRPDILVVDSIQTIATNSVNSMRGSVRQVQASAQLINAFARETGSCAFVICQVTKEGEASGPKALEHLVDAILSLDVGDEFPTLRCLRSSKNRFGVAHRAGWFEMRENGEGMIPVDEPPERPRRDLGALVPVTQELIYRLLELGAVIDPGLQDRLADLELDLAPRGTR